MLSARPTPHHASTVHNPHKENFYMPSKTPARGLSIHKDAGGAKTVGKGMGAKTPFGMGGAGGRGAVTTSKKGLGASLGPGRAAGQGVEGDIEPKRLFQSTSRKPSGSTTLPHSKAATFSQAPPFTTKPSFGDVTNGTLSQPQLRTPHPTSKRAFATPAPSRGLKQAVFQTPLPSATRTTRRRSSKLHTPLASSVGEKGNPDQSFSTPTNRTLPADASFELDFAPAGPALTNLLEDSTMEALAASDDEVEYMAPSARDYDEPASFGYEVPDPVVLGGLIRGMGMYEWNEKVEESYRASAQRSPQGWEPKGFDEQYWNVRDGSDDSAGYDSDEDLAALLNIPLASLKSHQHAGTSKPLALPSATSAPTRRPLPAATRPVQSSTSTRPAPTSTLRRVAPSTTSSLSRQRTSTAPPASASSFRLVRPTPPPGLSSTSTLTRRAPIQPSTTTSKPARPVVVQTPAEKEAVLRARRKEAFEAERKYVLACLEGLEEGADEDAGFALDA